jgi:hypothetical protein
MPKATIQDVTDAGFRAEQFGTPADWATPATGYVARVLADAAVWVTDRVGATAYAAATAEAQPAQFLRLKRAELCAAKAELWRRRAAFLDANAFRALEGNPSAAAERTSYLAHAQAAEECMLNNLDLFLTGGDATALGSGASIGHVESGPFRTAAGVPGLAT